jgi:hypothetical protein
MTKKCSECGETKPLTEFYKRKSPKAKGGVYRAHCKKCANSYKSQTPARVLERIKATRKRNVEFLWKYYSEHPCVDCGEKDPIVLEPDHLDPDTKIDNVSRLVHNTRSLAVIEAELEKCEIVC